VIEKIESKSDDESYFALVATWDIEKDEKITLCYGTGQETSLDLLSKYGFWTQNNPNDARLIESIAWPSNKDEDEKRLSYVTGTMKSIAELRIYLQSLKLQHEQERAWRIITSTSRGIIVLQSKLPQQLCNDQP
jgi:hypothetical protein